MFSAALRSENVVLWVKVARSAAELEGKAGPERPVLAASVEVPAGAARHPDGVFHTLLHLRVERLMSVGPYLDGPRLAPLHDAQGIQNIGELRLNHVDH